MHPYVLSFRHSPAILRRTAALVPVERRTEPLGEDRFTLVEMVGHLADGEGIFQNRLREAVARDVPEFARIDVDARAQEMRFGEGSLEDHLATYAQRRAETVEFLEGLPEAAWAREFVAPAGRTTIRDFVAFMAGHDLYHLEQASEYLPLP